MADEPSSTRRRFVKTSVAIALGGGFAGCSGDGGGSTPASESSETPTETDTPAQTATETPTATATATSTPESSSYSVSIEPVGEVTFESVPQNWIANNGSWADMGVALGVEPPRAGWLTSRYHTQYYDEVDGVSVDKSDMVSLYQDGLSKELFYSLDQDHDIDVSVMDPNFLTNRFKGWEESDVEEIDQNVAPLFGNCIYAQHYPWHDDYRYYTLYEGFEKLARVFQRMDRYHAFEEVHADFESNLAPVVPTGGDRPRAAVLWGVGDQPTQFYPYVIGGGTGFKHLRQLGVRDALAGSDIKDFHASRAAIDLETLLDIDPPVLLLRGYESKSREKFENTVVSFLQEDATASGLTAVKNGDVYRAGGLYQGPITYMVLTERLATRLYGFEGELFDRKRVADIVAGNL
ncbi:MAG: ABC transporter substrate-binding protein [Haloarculaceae archaeon]